MKIIIFFYGNCIFYNRGDPMYDPCFCFFYYLFTFNLAYFGSLKVKIGRFDDKIELSQLDIVKVKIIYFFET